MASARCFVLSCEHGGHRVPAPYRALFASQGPLLRSHRGYDLGILPLARRLAQGLAAPLLAAEVTRLLVDLNRSPGSATLFSEWSWTLSPVARQDLLQRYYHPYRQALATKIHELVGTGAAVVHLSIHSFTSELAGQVRQADLGLLYDPARPAEAAFCRQWQRALREGLPGLRVRRNYPYRGVADSLVRTLRRQFAPDCYLGIELEVNQSLPLGDPVKWDQVQTVLLRSIPGEQ